MQDQAEHTNTYQILQILITFLKDPETIKESIRRGFAEENREEAGSTPEVVLLLESLMASGISLEYAQCIIDLLRQEVGDGLEYLVALSVEDTLKTINEEDMQYRDYYNLSRQESNLIASGDFFLKALDMVEEAYFSYYSPRGSDEQKIAQLTGQAQDAMSQAEEHFREFMRLYEELSRS